jgi:hypothetical protein
VDFSKLEEESINVRICHFHQMALTSQQITAAVTESVPADTADRYSISEIRIFSYFTVHPRSQTIGSVKYKFSQNL